ncbi:MAG TPA: DUF3592 domain-containing protein [Thermoanaerobaculia bacterium]|nr:DUF3592 domain-containing protein [Thermoanaerobaculia bacterium]
MSFEFSVASPFALLVFSLVLSVMGCFLIYWSWRHSRIARETSGWTPVPATILRARAKERAEGYEPDIAYHYAIGGKEYESSQVSIINFYGTSLEGARRKAHRYVATQRVIAYVNPADHSQAVLIPGAQPIEASILFILGLLFAAGGAYLMVG